MKRPTRTIEAFYEDDGPYAVNPARAEAIYNTSAMIMGEYVGPVVLKGITGRHVDFEGKQITIGDIDFGHSDHAAILTRRELVSESVHAGGMSDVSVFGPVVMRSKVITRVQRTSDDITGAKAIVTNIHEMAHSFGLPHCETPDPCAMKKSDADLKITDDQLLLSGEVFCDPCGNVLEYAGKLAQGQEIGSHLVSEVTDYLTTHAHVVDDVTAQLTRAQEYALPRATEFADDLTRRAKSLTERFRRPR